MDPTYEFQAPQFVDFANLGENEDTAADDFFDVDMESGEHWVTALSSMGDEEMDQGASDNACPPSSRSDTTFQVSAPLSIPPPINLPPPPNHPTTLSLNLPPRKPSNMVTSWGPGHIIKTSGTGHNPSKAQAKKNPRGKVGRADLGATVTAALARGRNSPRHLHRTPKRLAVGASRYGAGTPKRLGTNCLEPRLAAAKPRTQIQCSLNTPTAGRIRWKSKSPSLPVPFPKTPDVIKRFKNKMLGAELLPSQVQPNKQPPTKYKSQAEQIASYQRSTPSRFRTRPQQQFARSRYGSVPQHQPKTAQAQLLGARPRLATMPMTLNLATKARSINRKKATVVETLAETTKNKFGLLRRTSPASACSRDPTRPTMTVPEPFKFSTQLRAGEREKFEMMKRQKETVAEEKKRIEDERNERKEQEALVQARKALVHRAQPIRNFKPIEIKRSDKKLTMPASPLLGTTRGANCSR